MESSVPLIKKELTFVFVVGLFWFFVVLVFCVGRSVVAFGKSGEAKWGINYKKLGIYKFFEDADREITVPLPVSEIRDRAKIYF